jgi:hypothetical protein
MKKVLISFLKLFHLLIIIVCFALSFGGGWGVAFAQIVIKERVEILPQNVILPETPAGEHTIRVDIQWSPASLRGWILYYNLQCDQNNYSSTPSTSGSNTYSLTSTGYENYNIQFRFGYLDPNQPTITGTYQLYYDEQLIRSQSFQAQPATYSSYAYFNTHYQSPVFNDYTFNIGPASLCFGNGTSQGFTLGHGCTSFEIDTSSEMVNLQILSGGEFASFYGYQGTITDNLTIPYSELNSVELKQDQFFSGSPTTVLVQSNIGGLIKQESIIAHPKSSYGINASTFDYPILYGETKYTEVKPTGPGGCTAIFPPEIKLNALITVGDDLGHLIDFDYGTEGDTLTNITFNSFGGNHIGFISDGVKKDIADTAIVTFSTSDAEIGMKQVAIIINPSPIYVAIEPENVAPGDTALIIIKSRQEDGTLIDFPGWQTFELKMIEGCNLGKILAVGDTARYFYDVPQPIKFIADSLAGGTVGLIVGLVEEIIGTRPVQENDADKIEEAAKEKQNKLNKEKSKKEVNENPTLNPGAEFCSIEEIQSFTTEEFDFVVGDVCSALPKCTENNAGKKPAIEVIDLPNGYGGTRDYCLEELGLEYEKGTFLNGYFTPVYRESIFEKLWKNYDGDKLFYDYQLELCYDEYANVIRFGIIGDKLLLKSIVGYCGDNLPQSIIKINNLEELRTKIPQDISSLSQAIDEIKKLKTYGEGGMYNIEELTWAHELKHLSNYQEQIVNRVNIYNDLLNYSKFDVTCSGQSNLNEVKDEMKENFDKKLLDFEDKLAIKQYEKWGSKSSSKESDKIKNNWNETTNTHDAEDVQNVIQNYIDEILIIIAEIHFGEIIIKP